MARLLAFEAIHGVECESGYGEPPQTRCGQSRFWTGQRRRLENFTRVETFGDNQANGNNDVHWLKVLVSPRTREVFAYQPQIVTANRAAVPAP